MRAVSANPFLDLPLAIASQSFALEGRLEQEMTPCQEKMPTISRARYAEVSQGVCSTAIGRLAEYVHSVITLCFLSLADVIW